MKLNRIISIITFLLFTLNVQGVSPPNIVFIMADDWGWGDLSCHGSSWIETPHLDHLASRGIDFHQFTTNSPICSPSRTAFLTGQYPSRNAIHQPFSSIQHHISKNMPDWLNPNLPHLPKILQQYGYKTGHFGKWHLSNKQITDAPHPKLYGFDTSAVFNGGGRYLSPENTCDAAIDFITNHQHEAFYINVWIHEPSAPHFPKADYLEKFNHLSEQQRVYAAVVAEADDAIGRLLKTLNDLGLNESTIVIFTADNGPDDIGSGIKYTGDISIGAGLGRYYSVGSNASLRGRKRSLYQGGINVPFIISWPGQIPMGIIDRKTIVTGVDLYPTLLHIAKIPMPEDYILDGIDITKALYGTSFKRKTPLYWEWNSACPNHIYNWAELGIRQGKWKLLTTKKGHKYELYNLKKSSSEKENIAHLKIIKTKRLMEKAKNWQSSLPEKPDPNCFSLLRKQEIGH